MGSRFLIDTNILVYFSEGILPSSGLPFVGKVFKESFNISVISVIEFLGWHGFSDEQYEEASDFISGANVLNIEEDVVTIAINIRRQRKIKLPDAIIAATCLGDDYTLLTRNVADFEKIDGLSILNPFGET